MQLVKTAFLKSTKASETYRQVIQKVANSFARPFGDFMQTDNGMPVKTLFNETVPSKVVLYVWFFDSIASESDETAK